MKCGNCGDEMAEGRTEVHGTLGGFLWYGWSRQHLFWYAADRAVRRQTRVIASGRGRRAWACRECGVITMEVGGQSYGLTRGRG